MPKLPLISPREAIAAFARDGWEKRTLGRKQKTAGSHIHVLTKPGHRAHLSIPGARKELARGTLRRLIRDADLTDEQFLNLHRKLPKDHGEGNNDG